MADTDAIVEQLSGLTVLEVSELVTALEEKWGVSAAAPAAVAVAAPGGGGGGGEAAEEKDSFDERGGWQLPASHRLLDLGEGAEPLLPD